MRVHAVHQPGTLRLPQRLPCHRIIGPARHSQQQVRRRQQAQRRAMMPAAVSVHQPESFQESPRRVAIFVEPSPFSHVSGMKNRFECLIKGLRDAGDDVMVFTPDRAPPDEYHGAKVVSILGFKLPSYPSPTLLLSFGLSVRVLWHLIMTRPHVIHASSPGVLVFGSILYAKLLAIPLVVSYHTHVPHYIPKYTWKGFVAPMWSLIRFCSRVADLTLVTSQVMKDELLANRCQASTLDVWQRGVDADEFHPRYRSEAMRVRLAGGRTDPKAILIYVGRLGSEKNLDVLKQVLQETPGAVLALVGDGPARDELEAHFAGLPVTFMGMLRGQELREAYASADVFMMPSESETLGFVVLEAMASGLPVIAVAAGGLLDIITQPGKTGYLYQPGDIDEAARLTRTLVSDPKTRKALGEAGRIEVAAWGWAAATARLRSQQYGRAIVEYRGKHLWRPLRELTAKLLRGCIGCLLAVCVWAARQLDYARPFRPEAHYQHADLVNGANDPLLSQ